ncbi:MAG TPA: proton-conducting transporter membrane subunit, partial [Acidimicrobiia bacterium]|nr:proton-conducting transporter membrane subunit [Acidimicrobiia bacterium]
MLAAVLGLHGVLALMAPRVSRRIGARVFLICSIGPAAAVIWGASQWNRIAEHGGAVSRLPWAPGLGLTLDFRLDGFGLLMLALVSGVGLLIFVYSRWYFADSPRLGRFAAIFTVFSGAMLGLILADDLLTLFVFWEVTSITSYLLIGFDDDKAGARAAALQAILVTGAGGLVMLAGFVILGQAAGTYSLSEIVAAPPLGGSVAVALALVLVGALTKSAQVPFHSWLPSAMAAPTPVSAYLHSAAMVMAGVYLVARLSPAFAPDHPFWRPTVVAVGLVTMLLGGYRALRQTDLKLLLAHGTVRQLGFMVALVGAGVPELTFAGTALVLTHGVFKAALFMVVGAIDKHCGTRDLRRLHRLRREMPGTFLVATVSVASMVGLPPTLGFLAKETAFEASLDYWPVMAAVVVLGSVITFAYSARVLWGAFGRKPEVEPASPHGQLVPEWPLLAPAGVLALVTLGFGLATGSVSRLVQVAANTLDSASTGQLYLWHGFNLPLAMSASTILAGTLLFVAAERVEAWQSRVGLHFGAQEVFESSLRGLNRVADRTTGLVQTGS